MTVGSMARILDIFTIASWLTSRSENTKCTSNKKMFGPEGQHGRRPNWPFEGYAHAFSAFVKF